MIIHGANDRLTHKAHTMLRISTGIQEYGVAIGVIQAGVSARGVRLKELLINAQLII